MKPMTREELEVARRDEANGDLPAHISDLIDQLVKENEELLEALTDVIWQACYRDGTLDSMALSAYADGLRLLGDHQVVSIEREYGRVVIAVQAGTRKPGHKGAPAPTDDERHISIPKHAPKEDRGGSS